MSLVGRAIKLRRRSLQMKCTGPLTCTYVFPHSISAFPKVTPLMITTDNGIFVIRHMQHHNKHWYTQPQFHLNDLRTHIAVEIVTHPRNIIINSISTSSSNYSVYVGHNAMAVKHRHAQHSEIGKCGDNHDFQFVMQNSSNASNGRKCRSHRLRRSCA